MSCHVTLLGGDRGSSHAQNTKRQPTAVRPTTRGAIFPGRRMSRNLPTLRLAERLHRNLPGVLQKCPPQASGEATSSATDFILIFKSSSRLLHFATCKRHPAGFKKILGPPVPFDSDSLKIPRLKTAHGTAASPWAGLSCGGARLCLSAAFPAPAALVDARSGAGKKKGAPVSHELQSDPNPFGLMRPMSHH